MPSRNAFLLLAAFGMAAFLSEGSSLAQSMLPSPDAKLCKSIPVADIEAAAGSKLVRKTGTDGDKYNSCTAIFGGTTSAKIEYHQPGQGGLPADVKSGLIGLTAVFGSDLKGLQTRDFGDIGCYQGALAFGGQEVKSTVCFLPKGYYSLSVGGLPNFVPMETVKALLEKTAAAFKAP